MKIKHPVLQPSTFEFLKQLKKNNNRDWFAKHKGRYTQELEAMVAFADALLTEMNKHDNIENESGKRRYSAFTAIPVFQKIKHLTKHIGLGT